MAVDKLVDSTQLDNDLTTVANAIRSKRGISNTLLFPSEFVTEINNITSVEKKSGSVVNFSATEIYTIPQMKIDVNPVQDLHGYNSPWPAGGGKNLLPPKNTATVNSVTFTTNEDGSVTVSGTASANAAFDIGRDVLTLPAGTYLASGTGTTENVAITIYKIVNGSASVVRNGAGSFTLTESTSVFFRMLVSNGATESGTAYPMIEAGSSASSYAPYSNICPITGWTGCNISQSGADTSNSTVLPISWQTEAGEVYGGTLDVVSGVLTVDRGFTVFDGSNDEAWLAETIAQKRNFYAPVSGAKKSQYGESLLCNLFPASPINGTRKDTVFISSGRNLNATIGDTLGISSVPELRTWLASNNLTICYELETPQTYQLTPEQLSVNYYKQTWTGATGESIQLYDTQARAAFILMTRYTKAETHSATDGLLTNYQTSNIYVSNTTQGTSADDNNITIKSTSYDSNYIYLFAPPSIIPDVAALRAYLANTPLEIQYPVETPFNYELYEKDHINTLIGVNNIWADTGDVHITVIGGL